MKTLPLETLDYRGRNGFPNDDRGFVYVHKEDRDLPERATGIPRTQRRTWAIVYRPQGWQVDKIDPWTGPEADPKLRGTWEGSAAAAIALRIRLADQTHFED